MELRPGAKIYRVNRGKAVIASVIGSESVKRRKTVPLTLIPLVWI